jgi:hypothetical protein
MANGLLNPVNPLQGLTGIPGVSELPGSGSYVTSQGLIGAVGQLSDAIAKQQNIPLTLGRTGLGFVSGQQQGVSNLAQMQQLRQKILESGLDIQQKQYGLAKAPYEVRELQQKVATGDIDLAQKQMSNTAIVKLLQSLPPEELAYAASDTGKFLDRYYATQPVFDEETLSYMNAIAGTTQFSKLTEDQKLKVATFSNAPSGEKAASQKIDKAKAVREGAVGLPDIVSREDLLNQLNQNQVERARPTQPVEEIVKEDKPVALIDSPKISPKEREQLLIKRPQAEASVSFAIDKTREMRNTATRLLNDPAFDDAFGLTGLGASLIPGSPAADVRATLDTLRNQSFVQGLSAMREASKTGGAVGNVTEAEGKRFENLRASLSQAQSPERARQELERMITELDESEERVSQAYTGTYGEVEFKLRPKTERIQTLDIPAVGTIVDGFEFLGKDPSKPENWRPI